MDSRLRGNDGVTDPRNDDPKKTAKHKELPTWSLSLSKGTPGRWVGVVFRLRNAERFFAALRMTVWGRAEGTRADKNVRATAVCRCLQAPPLEPGQGISRRWQSPNGRGSSAGGNVPGGGGETPEKVVWIPACAGMTVSEIRRNDEQKGASRKEEDPTERVPPGVWCGRFRKSRGP